MQFPDLLVGNQDLRFPVNLNEQRERGCGSDGMAKVDVAFFGGDRFW